MFDMLNEWLAWYRSSGFDHATIAVPLVETTVLLISITICLLFRFSRVGLIIAFLFLYRWGWTVQVGSFTTDADMQAMFSVGYIIFGILVATFTVVGMILHSRANVD
jgi:hypothetical protein